MKYTRLPAKASDKGPRRKGPIGAAKVSDEGMREQRVSKLFVIEHANLVKEKSGSLPGVGFRKSGLSHCSSGKHSARIQMGNVHERVAVRGL